MNLWKPSNVENLGTLQGAVIDVPSRSIVAWQVGKGRRARLVDYAHITAPLMRSVARRRW